MNRVITTPGAYSLTVTNTCGTATDALVVADGGSCAIRFPNAFTPNKDGANDEFRINYPDGMSEYFLEIFNRWGQRIFYTADPFTGWTGMTSGRPAPAGTYVFRAGYRQAGMAVLKIVSGSAILIR